MTDPAHDPANPPPISKSQNGLPAPLRILLKFIMYLGLAATIFWVAMSLVLNYYLRNSFEMYLTGMLHQPTRILGGIRLGTDLAKPSLVLSDIRLEKDPLNPQAPEFKVDSFEAGLPWQVVKEGQENLLSFFVKIDNVSVDGKPYGSFEIPVKALPAGDFEMKDIKGTLKQAVFAGDLVKTGTVLQADGKATGIDYGQIVEGATGGNVSVDIKLTGAAGGDMPAILPYVSGTALISGGEGTMAGNLVGFWAGSIAQTALDPAHKDTKINCVVGDFTIDKGVMTPKALIFDTGDATIYGQGYIDFTRQYADMVFTPQPKAGAAGTLAVPLNISGPFNALVTSPDSTAIAAKLAQFMTGAPAVPMQPLPPTDIPGENACLAYLKGSGHTGTTP